MKINAKVPSCWARLVDVVFEFDGIDGYAIEGTNHPVRSSYDTHTEADDPEAYLDDYRMVISKTDDGTTVEIILCSGQNNYYIDCTIRDKYGSVLYDSEGGPWESLSDEEEVVGVDGDTYIIVIEWEGDDIYKDGYPFKRGE